VAQRNITDAEIALIKAMVARGMKNSDVQFFFNRPERHVNLGRMTVISKGTYGNSAKIPAASSIELDAFLASHKPAVGVHLAVAATAAPVSNPLDEATLRKMFTKVVKGPWRLTAGEPDWAECKKSFGMKHPAPWLRAVAALANNRGGYVFFGVSDKDADGHYAVVGLSTEEFAETDPADIAIRLRSTFDPTPRFQTTTIEIGGKKVGVLHVEQHASRPIIATKNDGGSGEIKEGDIFFRYPGTSSRITYSDLRAMLDARDAQVRADILPMVERLLALGPARAMVMDLADGQLMDGKRIIEINEDIIKNLTFIKEGEFDEKVGAPALRLIGDVQSVAMAAPLKKGFVTRADLRRDFLLDKLQADALDYVRIAVEVSGSDWLPIRYFAQVANMSHLELIGFITNNAKAPAAQKKLYLKRLSSRDEAYVKPSGPAAALLTRLLAGDKLEPKDAMEARQMALAVQGIPHPLNVDAGILRTLLSRCLTLIEKCTDQFAKTAIRKAMVRLDELTSP
jgi:hypothetical protein